MRIYECCICHKVLERGEPIRLVKQKYAIRNYTQYSNVQNYDFCKKCYAKFHNWIKKHEVDK